MHFVSHDAHDSLMVVVVVGVVEGVTAGADMTGWVTDAGETIEVQAGQDRSVRTPRACPSRHRSDQIRVDRRRPHTVVLAFAGHVARCGSVGNSTQQELGMKIVGAFLVGVGMLSCLSARAELVDLGVTTRDTASGLEWLDLSQTTGYSFDELLGQFGTDGKFAGFRYASAIEAQGVLAQLGLPIAPYAVYRSGVLSAALARFDALFGLNVGGAGPAYGFAAEVGDALPGYPGYHAAYFGFPTTLNTDLPLSEIEGGFGDLLVSTREVTVGYASGYKDRNLGYFVVRQVSAVPEPQTLALMLGGLLLTTAVVRRRRRRR